MTAKARTKAEEPAEDAAASTTPPEAAASDAPKRAKEPSFGMSEGMRDELARTGRAVSPFTGRVFEDADRLAEVRAEAKRSGESVPREA